LQKLTHPVVAPCSQGVAGRYRNDGMGFITRFINICAAKVILFF